MAKHKRQQFAGGALRPGSGLIDALGPGIGPAIPTTHPPVLGDPAALALVPSGSIRFWPPSNPKHIVMLPMGDHGLTITRQAGWEGLQRPFGLAISAWRGMPAVEASVDVILERWDTQDSVRPAYEQLTGLMNMGPHAVRDLNHEPPALFVTVGGTDAVALPQDDATRWVITSIAPDDDATVRNAAGHEIRIEATIGLMQYVGPQALRDRATTIRKATPKPTKRKPYKAKKGDTLIGIAGSQLHDRSRWHELLKLNPKVKSPRQKLKGGELIRLPA